MKRSLKILALCAALLCVFALPCFAEAAKVYFSRDISPEAMLKLYRLVNSDIKGHVAIKLHTGEPHGPNILPVEMVKAVQQTIPNSALVDTNTLYKGGRDTTEKHRKTIKINGWTFCPVDILDENGAVMLPVKGGKRFKEMSFGKNLKNYDSMVVLTHFKGHTMGGFGGSIKNVAIGCADAKIGKPMQHSTPDNVWGISKAPFMENMVEAAMAVLQHFGKNTCYINVMRNMSVDCDCTGTDAKKPTAPNIGILASRDIVAIDQACIDLLWALPNEKSAELKERITSREGLHQLEYGEKMGLGTRKYELIEVK